MDLISHLLPSQTELSLQHWDLDTAIQPVTVYLASTQNHGSLKTTVGWVHRRYFTAV